MEITPGAGRAHDRDDKPKVANAAVFVSDLRRRFAGQHALEGITLVVPTGSIFGILGPNGAGKTTLIRILSGLIPASSGEVRVLGLDPIHEGSMLRRHIGCLLDVDGLYERLSGRQNLEFYGRAYGLDPDEVWTNIGDLLKRLRIADRIDTRVENLSRGMKRKLALARALLHTPELLILDEPTTGLDVEATAIIRRLLQALADAGRTILLATNNLVEADELCDQVAVLNLGKIAARGTPQTIRDAGMSSRLLLVTGGLDPAAAHTLQGLSYVRSFWEEGDGKLLFDLTSMERVGDLVAHLVHFGVNVKEVRPQRAKLEEVFLQLTERGEADA